MEVDPENKESDLSEEEGVLEVNGDMKDKIKKSGGGGRGGQGNTHKVW